MADERQRASKNRLDGLEIALVTWLLFTVTIILAIWSLSSRNADRVAALLIAIALIFASGLRRDGYDYDNYLLMIEKVRESASMDVDFTYRLVFGKDPMFIWVTDLLTPLSGDATWPVFLAFGFIAVSTKYIAALSLPRYSAVFLAIYLIFLSPTLEFSGIRAAAGIGILMMAIAYPLRLRVKLPLLVSAMATHISLIFSSLVYLLPHFVRSRWAHVALAVFMAMVAFVSSGLLSDLQRGEIYIGKTGTIFAVLFPLISLSLFFAQLWATDPGKEKIYLIIAVTLGLAMGLALPSVGVSHRIMEIGLCLLLFAIMKDFANGYSKRNKALAILVMVGFIAFETFHHIFVGNWLAITII